MNSENHKCSNCGGTNTVAVWEDETRWQNGEPPKFVGCHDCHIMEE